MIVMTPTDEKWFTITSDFVSNTFEVTPNRDGFTFELDHPWAGSTDAGFGQTLSDTLTVEEAVDLANWILAVVQDRTGAK